MISDPSPDAKTCTRFANPPWTEHSESWRDLDEKLPPDHLAREIREAMIHLDLSPLYRTYQGLGKAPYRPDLMLAMVLFELRRGRPKPSQWHQDTQENYPLWWLGFGIAPSRSCWYEFRTRTGSCLDTLNTTLLHQAVAAELTTAERGALDGSAVAANASRRRLINGDRLGQRLEQLGSVAQDEAQGEEIEAVPGWMENTPVGRRRQQSRYIEAQDALIVLQAANAKRPPSQRRPLDKVVVSPGDPEAPLGLDKDHVFRPLYTVQTVRDVESPFILGYEVFAQASDAATLPPMLRRSHQLTGRTLKELLVDCGYVTGMDLAECASQGVTLYGPWKESNPLPPKGGSLFQKPTSPVEGSADLLEDVSASRPTPIPLPAKAGSLPEVEYDLSKSKTPALFSKDRFTWHRDLDAYRCPTGHLLKRSGCHKRECSGGREVMEWSYRAEAQTCQACPLREACTTSKKGGRSVQRSEHDDLIVAHRAWMETAEAKAVYRLRGQTIEIVFADVKEHRGLRRFSGHGLDRVRTEFALEVLLHNLLAMQRSLQKRSRLEAIEDTTEDIAA